MRITAKRFRKNGFHYRPIKQGMGTILYAQFEGPCERDFRLVGYEVHKILLRPAKQIGDKLLPAHLRRPADGDFGNLAWSFYANSYYKAFDNFKEIEKDYRRSLKRNGKGTLKESSDSGLKL